MLYAALKRTARGKRRRRNVAWLLFAADEVVYRLAASLRAGTWRPAPLGRLLIRDPKPRLIAVAPVEDRLVHNAMGTLLEQAWVGRLMPENYACRRGMGTHRARLAIQRAMRKHRFAVHLDVRSYFPSVDLDILRGLLAHRIRDPPFLALLDRVLDAGAGLLDSALLRRRLGMPCDWPPAGQGLPIGAFTSQVLATHVYLCDLDHYVKRTLKVPAYVRYVDDLFLFADRRAHLKEWRAGLGEWLRDHRGLRLKHPRARVLSGGGSLHALGRRIDRASIRPLLRQVRRVRGAAKCGAEASMPSRVSEAMG